MKPDTLKDLQCPLCKKSLFDVNSPIGRHEEYRRGAIKCKACGHCFSLDDGIADFLPGPSPEIKKERKAALEEARIKTDAGESFCVTPENIRRFEKVFASLPRGDGSYFFKAGGSFQNFAEGAHRFFSLVETWPLEKGTKVLELGAGFCWASREFAERGCRVSAIDITDYLKVADIYLERGLFFERFYADMNNLPFKDKTFDLIFAAATIHHSSDLKKTFKELYRLLKKNGRIILLNECFIGILEKPQQHDEDFGYNDHYYTLPEWKDALKAGGFDNIRITFLSFLKDYIARKKVRGRQKGFKITLARFITRFCLIDRFINTLLLPYRFFFRPKSILIEAVKRT